MFSQQFRKLGICFLVLPVWNSKKQKAVKNRVPVSKPSTPLMALRKQKDQVTLFLHSEHLQESGNIPPGRLLELPREGLEANTEVVSLRWFCPGSLSCLRFQYHRIEKSGSNSSQIICLCSLQVAHDVILFWGKANISQMQSFRLLSLYQKPPMVYLS